MRRTIILFTILSCVLTARAQGYLRVDTTQFIEWNEERPLRWSDYRLFDEREVQTDAFALTTVFHSIRGGMSKGKPNFQVRVLYVKEKSWTTNIGSNALLSHEKLHFDLAELYGRKLRKQIESLGRQGEKRIKTYQANIQRLLDDFKLKSYAYDEETNHGRISDAQKEWERFVSAELRRLNKYKYLNTNK